MSLDEMHDDDARSIAASSHVSSHISVSRSAAAGREPVVVRRPNFEPPRESSKESSNSESDEHFERPKEIIKTRTSQSSMSSDISRLSQFSMDGPTPRAGTPPLATPPTAAAAGSPTSRRMRMVKSLSQDAATEGVIAGQMTSSVSDGALHSSALYRLKPNTSTLDEVRH